MNLSWITWLMKPCTHPECVRRRTQALGEAWGREALASLRTPLEGARK